MTAVTTPHATRGNGGHWLIPLADLSLILFIITAVTLSAQPEPSEAQVPQPVGSFAQGVPASVYVDLRGGPTLGQWLTDYQPGSGEQLTVEGYFIPAERDLIAARAEQLAQQALEGGFQPRVILQPAAQSQVQALFAADANPALEPQVAQSLQGEVQQ